MVGVLTELFGVFPALAYNLILPTTFASPDWVCSALPITWCERKPTQKEKRPMSRQVYRGALGWKGRSGGVRLRPGWSRRIDGTSGWQPRPSWCYANAWHETGDAALEELPVVGSLARIVDGGIKAMKALPCQSAPVTWFWNASRAINADPGEAAITELPFFTFLYGDLHAHMISLPLTLLALGWAISLALLVTRRARSVHERGNRAPLETALLWLVGAIAIGALRATNTWDWPTYLLLGSIAALAYAFEREGHFSLPALGRELSLVAVLFGLSSLAFWPYTSNFGSGYDSAVALGKARILAPATTLSSGACSCSSSSPISCANFATGRAVGRRTACAALNHPVG